MDEYFPFSWQFLNCKPRANTVPNLSSLVAHEIGSSLLIFLESHVVKKCKWCTKEKRVIEKCPDMLALMNQVNETPIHANEMIWDASFHLKLEKRCESFENDDDNPTRLFWFNVSFLTHWLFDSTKYKLFWTLEDDFEIQFFRKLGNHIDSLRYMPERCRLKSFHSSVEYATNLRDLDILQIKATGKTIRIIGKYCNSMVKFTGALTYKNTIKKLSKLFFQGSERLSVKNRCCYTLENVQIKLLDPGSLTENRINEKDFQMFQYCLNNITNLKCYGFESNSILEDIIKISDEKPGFICKLQEIECDHLNVDLFSKLKLFCPDVSMLHVVTCDVETLRLIHTCGSVTNFCILNFDDDVLLYEGILATPWTTIKVLWLYGKVGKLNLDAIASTLENLHKITVISCKNILWQKKSNFKCLEYCNFGFQSDCPVAVDWFRSFSSTISYISVLAGNINLEQIPSLISGNYPNLKYLEIHYLSFASTETLKNVVANCPNLCKLGIFQNDGAGMINECKKYFEQNNINCSLEIGF